MEPDKGGRPAYFGESKYPLVPPPKQEGAVWPGAPDYLYIQIETDPCAPGNDPPMPEAPIGYASTGVRITRRRQVVCGNSISGALGSFAFIFQYVDQRLLNAVPQPDDGTGGGHGSPPAEEPSDPSTGTPSVAYPDGGTPDCERELWLGVFFEGARDRGVKPFTGTILQKMKSEYVKLARERNADVRTNYFTYQTDISSTGWDTTQFLTNHNAAANWLCSYICPYLTMPCDDVDLRLDFFGWSRGAIAAMYMAGYLDSVGCVCRDPRLPGRRVRHRNIRVRWLGLIDPVDSNLTDTPAMLAAKGSLRVSDWGAPGLNLSARRYILPSNVERLHIAESSIASNVGRIVFHSDLVQVVPNATRLIFSPPPQNQFEVTHERIGFYSAAPGVYEAMRTWFETVADGTSKPR